MGDKFDDKMTPEEKAIDLYEKFQQYRWDKTHGYIPDDEHTKRTASNVTWEIVDALIENNKNLSIGYWYEVRKCVNKL